MCLSHPVQWPFFKTGRVVLLLFVLLASVSKLGLQIAALSTGAPSLACASLQPLHGLHRPKPASASQFFVSQSSLSYEGAQNITVEITTHSDARTFRGFIVQAYNPVTGNRIGQFLASETAKPMASCSSATHRSRNEKKSVKIVWRPPSAGHESEEAASASSGSNAAGQPSSALASLAGNWLGLVSPRVLQKRASEAAGKRQVRFKASIVVSYGEFYTGFESSELNFERFNYSPASNSSALA